MKRHLYSRGLAILIGSVALLVSMPAGAQGVEAETKNDVPPQLPKAPSLQPASTQSTRATPAALDAWRKAISKTPRPKEGCFEAKYPETAWREVACKAPLNKLYFPKPPKTVRPGNSWRKWPGLFSRSNRRDIVG